MTSSNPLCRAAGIILAVAGLAFFMLHAWRNFPYASALDAIDWTHFAFRSWLGISLILTGFGMQWSDRNSTPRAVVRLNLKLLVTFFLIASSFLFLIQKFDKSAPHGPRPSRSSRQAKARGTWRANCSVQPPTFEADGKEFRLGEAWIEELVEPGSFIWFKRSLGKEQLSLIIPRRNDGALSVDNFGEESALIAGEDFQQVGIVSRDQRLAIEAKVVFREWPADGKNKTTELGTVKIVPTR